MASPDNAAVDELVVVTGPPGAGKPQYRRSWPAVETEGARARRCFLRLIETGIHPAVVASGPTPEPVIIEAAAAAAGRLCEICFVVYESVVGPWLLPTFVRATGLADLHYVALLASARCLYRARPQPSWSWLQRPGSHSRPASQFAAAVIDAQTCRPRSPTATRPRLS